MPPGPIDHLDGDRVVLLALGETVATDTEREHLGHCDACVDDLASTAAVVTLGRDAPRLSDLPAPPPRVWQSIARSISAPAPPPVVRLVPAPLPHRRRPALALVGAALVAFALGAGVVIGAQRLARPPVAASAALAPQALAPAAARGAARIVGTDGGRRLQVHVTGMPAPDGYYEVWLYDPASGVMVAVGALDRSGDADLAVPAALDPTRFTVVDVSVQPVNGDPAHGTSMLRGTLH